MNGRKTKQLRKETFNRFPDADQSFFRRIKKAYKRSKQTNK